MEHQTKNTNTLYVEHVEMLFKQRVRYILHDLQCEPEYAHYCGDNGDYTDEQLSYLKDLIYDYKAACVELWEYYQQGKRSVFELTNWLEHYLNQWHVRLIWVEGVYNSLILNIDEYIADKKFEAMEEAHDEYMCEMAETSGMGYSYIESLQKERESIFGSDEDEDEDLPF